MRFTMRGARNSISSELWRNKEAASMKEWTDSLFKVTEEVPVLFLANKSDIIHKAEFKPTDLEAIAAEFKSPYFYTSAKSGANVERAFFRLGELMIYPLITNRS